MSDFEVRKVQCFARNSLGVYLPKKWIEELGAGKGSYMKIHQEGDCIIVEPYKKKGVDKLE